MPYKDINARREHAKKYQQKHYLKNKQYYFDKAKKQKQTALVWFNNYKKTLCCSKCHESHISCLDFHHNKGEKEMGISQLVRRGRSIKNIKKELDKCIPLCANCHRKKHYKSGAK